MSRMAVVPCAQPTLRTRDSDARPARRGTISLEELAALQVIHGPRCAQPETYDAWVGVIRISATGPRPSARGGPGAAGMRAYGELCGWTLARAHARSGDRFAIAAYLGQSAVFDQAIAEFAAAYADQNERDHQALTVAVASGCLTASTGGSA